MLVPAIIESLIRTVSVLRTSHDRYEYDHILDLVEDAAAWAKQEKFKKEHDVPEQWKYTYELPYLLTEQNDDCYTSYFLPPYLTLPDGFSGITSVRGSKGGNIIRLCPSRDFYENTQQHPLFNNGEPVSFIEGKYLKTKNVALGTVKVTGLFTRILENKLFNPDFDDYPVTNDLLWLMRTYITNQYLNPMAVRPVPEVNTQSAQNQLPAQQVSPQQMR